MGFYPQKGTKKYLVFGDGEEGKVYQDLICDNMLKKI